MRKILISLLLASALAPVSAQVQDEDKDRNARTEAERSDRAIQRNNSGTLRTNRVEDSHQTTRSERAERPQRAAQADNPPDRSPRINQSSNLERATRSDRIERRERPARVERAASDPPPVQQTEPPINAQPVQNSSRNADGLVGGFRNVSRDIAAGKDNDHDDDHKWSDDWRKDKRYDWWSYRGRHRSLYRLGHYYDPYGWGYRRWSAGYSLWPSYYGSGFWLNDPWMYRLPPAHGPYRWVRYYDDALLVNIYSGHVVDVVYNFFW